MRNPKDLVMAQQSQEERESYTIDKGETDRLLRLTDEEERIVQAALMLYEERMVEEGDDENKKNACRLINRLKYADRPYPPRP